MSSLGIQVIHTTLNSRIDTACERVFIPEPQYIRELIKQKTPLFSLETQTPLHVFDIVGFLSPLSLTISIFHARWR